MSQGNYSLLLKKLDEFIRKFYLNQLIRGTIWLSAVGLVLFLSVSLLEYFGNFNSSVRAILFYGSFLTFALVALKFIGLPLSRFFAIGKQISHEQAAKIIGDHFSEVEDKLLNVLQLRNEKQGLQTELIEASIAQKIDALKPIPFTLAINLSENKAYLKYLIPPLSIIAALVLFSPEVISESTSRLVAYNQEYEPVAPYSIELTNQQLRAFQNEDFKLSIKLLGKQFPDQMRVDYGDQSFFIGFLNIVICQL
jgi:hypothetical protein